MSHFLPIMGLPVVLQSYSLFQAYHNSSENVVASSKFFKISRNLPFPLSFFKRNLSTFVKCSLFILLKSHCLNGYVSFFLKKIFHIFHKMFTGMEKIFTFFSFNHETSKSFENDFFFFHVSRTKKDLLLFILDTENSSSISFQFFPLIYFIVMRKRGAISRQRIRISRTPGSLASISRRLRENRREEQHVRRRYRPSRKSR